MESSGIEDARQHLGGDFLVDGVEEIAAAELQEIEVLVGGGAPEPKRVDGLAAIADDRPIIGNSAQDGRHVRRHGQPPFPHLESAIEPDLHGLGRPNDLPGVGTDQPVVGMLDLPPVLDLLAEHAVLVAEPIADRRDLQRRQRVEKTGRQPAEPAIAQPGVGLFVEQSLPVVPGVGSEVVADEFLDLKVGDVVRQRPADQELHRKVVHLLRVLALVRAFGQQPALGQQVADRAGHRLEPLARVGLLLGNHMVEDQVPVVVVVIGEAERAALVAFEEFRGLGHAEAPGIRRV